MKFNVGEAILAASITKTSAEKLTLAAGHLATAIFKASHVIVGVE